MELTSEEWIEAEGSRLGIDPKLAIIPKQYDYLLTSQEWIENEAKRLGMIFVTNHVHDKKNKHKRERVGPVFIDTQRMLDLCYNYSDWVIFLSIFIPGAILFILGILCINIPCLMGGILCCLGALFYAIAFGGSY